MEKWLGAGDALTESMQFRITESMQFRITESMQFRITESKQFRALEFSLFLGLFTVGCMFYFHFFYPNFHQSIFVWLLLIQRIPVLFLHVEYYFLNRGDYFNLEEGLHILEFVRKNYTIRINIEEIAQVVVYAPPSNYRGLVERKIQFLPFESYSYAVLYSKNGDKIILTSLVMHDLCRFFEERLKVPVLKKKRFFASPIVERLTNAQ